MLTVGMYLADRYEIVGKVGAGGMSDVYKAKDHILGRFVAIKVLKQEFSEDRNFVAKFRSEAQSAAGLEHPNIVNIYDVGSEEGLYYIVMEYVEGITLKTYIEKKGQLSFKEAISIAIQVARGIESAHNKNIIHRDIKPQNIIISTEGKVKVTDFGIARAASSNTISSDVMGSVHYASPEQARNGFVDNRSDIYSLGIVMYEMVTGRVPFDGDTTVAVAIQHLQEEMVIPSVYAQNLPISLEKIILKCAQKNPDRRYQSMEELLADLRKSLMNPNEDFVVIAPLVDNGKTKVISEEDISKIKGSVSISPASDAKEPESLDEKKTDSFDDEEDEDEDEGILNPKMDKAVTIMGIVVAAIIVIVIIYFMGMLFGLFKFGKKGNDQTPSTQTQQTETQQQEIPTVTQVSMVNVVGLSQDAAISQIQGLGLLVSISVEESDEEQGVVLRQSISEGDKVSQGSYVELVISGGASVKMVTLTDLSGKAEADAVSLLTGLGLVPDKTYEYSEEVAAGLVISQDPTTGYSVAEGSTVKLIISQGKQAITAPNVIGKDQNTAVAELSATGLTVTVAQESNDAYPAGTVFWQSIEAGKTVEQGSAITITVSVGSGSAPVEEAKYVCNYQLAVPDGVSAADITLYDGNGNVLSSWNHASVQGGSTYTISIPGITGSSTGTIKVTWYTSVTDEDGNTTEKTTSETYAVTFTKQ